MAERVAQKSRRPAVATRQSGRAVPAEGKRTATGQIESLEKERDQLKAQLAAAQAKIVKLELARDEAFPQVVARGTETAEAAWGHSVHAQPRELAPSRAYFYRFTALGVRSATGRTRTAPPAGANESLAFAIAASANFPVLFMSVLWKDCTTKGAVNFPELPFIEQSGKTRILHVHRNVPGALGTLDNMLATHGLNIVSQSLQTKGQIGYAVTDVDNDVDDIVLAALRDHPITVRCERA